MRRLWVLVKGLPAEAALHDEDRPRWSIQDELLARAVEQTSAWGRMTVLALGAKSSQVPPVHEVEHPDREVPRPKLTTDPTAIRNFFARR